LALYKLIYLLTYLLT